MTTKAVSVSDELQSDEVLIQRIECLKTWPGYFAKPERDKTFDMIIKRLRQSAKGAEEWQPLPSAPADPKASGDPS